MRGDLAGETLSFGPWIAKQQIAPRPVRLETPSPTAKEFIRMLDAIEKNRALINCNS